MKNAMTRAISWLLVLILALSMCVFTYAVDSVIPGDIDNDGEITVLDVLRIAKAVVNDTALENSDVNGDGKTNLLDVIGAIKLVANGKAPEIGEEEKNTADIVVENGAVKEAVSITGETVSAAVPEGVAVEDGATSLTLSVTALDNINGNITTEETEEAVSYDVHIEGVSEENTVPIIVSLGAILPAGQNTGTVTLYHIEYGEVVEMVQVMTLAELDAHNEFYYYPATGDVYVALATFSEVALVNDTANAWNGTADHSWYDAEKTELTIANANQLWSFSQIVGGMADGIAQDDFHGKTVKLAADINIGDTVDENGKVFYPIGYHNNVKSYDKVSGGKIESNVSSFEGVFDGTGHKIKDFYQNTWEMFGDYNSGYSGTPNHYKDAMGLFGYVYGGTVKNLTVENFSSDGEFTPTGVIAAYARNATFENIAIVNCNPRVYNTGNGGIVGIGGSEKDTSAEKLTFKNITIDNTNKISALWGSWDVGCGGIMGMYYRNKDNGGSVYFENCHVAAQIDVYNDVCGNYQYYWYRYSGMMIGTNTNMVTDANGYTVPDMTGITAADCTVHFGDWNNYYYCELVANSLASYTHDHQFSRLTEVDNVDIEGMTVTVDGKTTDIPLTGTYHYVVVEGNVHSTENATCYHFVEGQQWTHDGEDGPGYETVDGEYVLVEDKQHVYLPFNQLFTGYGWGVKHIPVYNGEDYAFEGIEILDRETADSVQKFTATTQGKVFTDGLIISAENLFKELSGLDSKVAVQDANVTIGYTPVGDSTATATVTPSTTGKWEDIKIKLDGEGYLNFTIQDYYFCKPTTVQARVVSSSEYHYHADGNSYLIIEFNEATGKYELVCEKCSFCKELGTEAPTVYIDPETKVNANALDGSIGITPETAVKTLKEAVNRLRKTGGNVMFLSAVTVGSSGITNLPVWEKEITFTSLPSDTDTATTGFRVVNHGPTISFNGPTKLERLVINGYRSPKLGYNNSDDRYYNIPVFVANWNDFSVGKGMVTFGASYFVIGNYFKNGTVGDYIGEECVLDLGTYDENGNVTPKTVKVELCRTTACNITDTSATLTSNQILGYENGNPIIAKQTATFDRVYLGTRSRCLEDFTVKNVHIDFISHGATFNIVFAGTVASTYALDEIGNRIDPNTVEDRVKTYPIDGQMENYTIKAVFNGNKLGSTTQEDAYINHFQVGLSNCEGSGTAYLDKLELEFNGSAYIKDYTQNAPYWYVAGEDGRAIAVYYDEAQIDAKYNKTALKVAHKDHRTLIDKGFVTRNVRELITKVSNGADRANKLNQAQFFFSRSSGYTPLGNETATLYFGTHSFRGENLNTDAAERVYYPAYNKALYGNGTDLTRVVEYVTNECEGHFETVEETSVDATTGETVTKTVVRCSVCGRDKGSINTVTTRYPAPTE